ncbi:hypothetical protein B0G75_13624 [Paraburkholderia sp. BL18I3N2]|nr:hypothetical protein B0G75_13624 [Paraburkholderia sp. BL18I3N2]
MMTFAVFGAGFLMRPLGAMALVQMAGQIKFFPIDMDTISIEKNGIPDSERSGIFKSEHGEVELPLANAMHQFDA